MIFIACLTTVVVETLFFYVCGYKKCEDIFIIICCNVLTNLILNLVIQIVFHGAPGGHIYWMEALVVLSEFWIYCAAFGRNFKLLLFVLTANCMTYGIGLLLF